MRTFKGRTALRSAISAARLLELAQTGDALAQYDCGVAYENGYGFTQDYRLAFYWYNRAAEQDDTDAQVAVGEFLMRGLGVEGNRLAAVKWFQIAMNHGNDLAKQHLSNMVNKPIKLTTVPETETVNSQDGGMTQ